VSSELKQYVETTLGKGTSKAQIRQTLIQSGWAGDVVEKTLDQYVGVDAQNVPIPAPRMQAHQLARDIFCYLLTFVTLTMTACALGAILFEWAESAFPDVSSQQYNYYRNNLNWAMAQLLITFPIYAGLSFWTGKDLQTHPEKRESMIRKLMIYFILLIAAVVGLGDLITVLNHFFDGEVTFRFLTKAAIVLGISGGIFGYYLKQAREDDQLVRLTDTTSTKGSH
jgi:hypothetical protein